MSNLRARATLVDQFLEVTGRSRHQVELELEPAHVVVAGLCEVLLDMLGEVGVVVGGQLLEEGRNEVREVLGVDGVPAPARTPPIGSR